MKVRSFEQLNIWKKSIEIASEIYLLTNRGDFVTDFGLRSKIQRSVVSISANIAEGFERNSNKEFLRFLKIAKGSLGETRSHLHIAKNLKYIKETEFIILNSELVELVKKLNKLITYLKEPVVLRDKAN